MSNFVQIYKDLTILYHTFLSLYLFASRIAGLFSEKAALFYDGRRGLLAHIKQVVSSEQTLLGTRYWIHCASVGEFEQARPLIERIKEEEPLSYIVITFFSPSGYKLRKNYNLASNVFYLPMDTKANARKFVEYIKPNVAIFIKYEFWKNYLTTLKEQNIPTYLVSAIFREDQSFFKWWGANFRKILSRFTHIFVQDSHSKTLLESIGYTNVSVAGDTRFDRVIEITRNNKTIPSLEFFIGNKNINEQVIDYTCCVAGSTWPPDEELLLSFLIKTNSSALKMIIAPHEVSESHIKKIESLFNAYKIVKYSDFLAQQDKTGEQQFIQVQIEKLINAQIFIIDTVGILSTAYRYGNFAYVGGGFGTGIHNILEAATYGLPVVFGPKYEKFKEAVDLIALGGAFSVEKGETEVLEKLFVDSKYREYSCEVCEDYVKKNIGATARILKTIAPI